MLNIKNEINMKLVLKNSEIQFKNYVQVNFILGLTDNQFNNATEGGKARVNFIYGKCPIAFRESIQSQLVGKKLLGVRCKGAPHSGFTMESDGRIAIYKADSLSASANLTYLTSFLPAENQIKNCFFDSPIILNEGEYLCFSSAITPPSGFTNGNSNEIDFGFTFEVTSGEQIVSNPNGYSRVGRNDAGDEGWFLKIDPFYLVE